jgi:hypothetical protein
MSVTIEEVCYKWKKLKNNEIPLMIRVAKERKKRHFNLGVSLKPEYWDFENKRPKRNCPNKEQVLEYKIEGLYADGRRNYAMSYKQLLKYNVHLDIYFSDIDVPWLKGYEAWDCNRQQSNGH